MEGKSGDIRLDGSGSASGGSYDKVKINGAGKITGDLECAEFTVNGAGEASGKVTAEKIKFNGSGRIGGSAWAKEIKVNGSGVFDDEVSCGEFSVSGSAVVGKSLRARAVKINGSLTTSGDCSAERFESDGVFEIDGLLNSEEIDVTLHWHRSFAKEIGGENIRVRMGHGNLIYNILSGLGHHVPELRADLIEGSEITLENTKAAVVRGTNITIGNGCEIGLVEYKGVLRKLGESKISSESKLNTNLH